VAGDAESVAEEAGPGPPEAARVRGDSAGLRYWKVARMSKVVLRLLDADGGLVGSVVHQARLRGDGCLRASEDVIIQIHSPMVARVLSVHWCDPNVEVRMPVAIGGLASFVAFRVGDPLIRIGDMPGPLPAITVGSVAVGIPVGAMGARG
jgi:hypothetical protein